jgi:hypothetical protein
MKPPEMVRNGKERPGTVNGQEGFQNHVHVQVLKTKESLYLKKYLICVGSS